MESSYFSTNTSFDYIQPYEPNETAMIVFTAIVTILGLLGNGSLVFIIIRNRHMRNVPNLQILSLASSDFIYLLLRVPADVAYYAHVPWPFSEAFCKLTCSMVFISQAVSVFTFAALSAERYYAIVKPMQRRKMNVVRATVLMVVGIWAASCLFSVPAIIMAKIDRHWDLCTMPIMTRQYRIFIVTMFLALYVVPLILISVFYALTANTLLKSNAVAGKNSIEHKQLSGGTGGGGKNGIKSKSNARTRLAIIILIAAILFALCWMPFYIYELWTEFDPHFQYTPNVINFMYVHYLMPMLGSCINPFLLYIMSSNYRRHFMKHFYCCRRSAQLDRGRTSGTNKSWTMVTAFKSATVVSRSNSEHRDIQMKKTSPKSDEPKQYNHLNSEHC